MLSTRNVFKCLVLISLTAWSTLLPAQKKSKKPNVIFILADDMGFADLSCYGNMQIRTPHLDQMAAEGFKAGSFVVPAPTCSPARASFLTGKYPIRVGIPYALGPGNKHGLNDTYFSIAKMFKRENYQTMMIGKWHLGDRSDTKPTGHGFDHYYGMMYSHDYKYPFVKTDTTLAIFEDNKRVIEKPDFTKLMDHYTDNAKEFISEASKKDQPFFLYLPYPMPHAPVGTTDQWSGKSDAGKYGDVIEHIDGCVGQILTLLRQLDIDENTLVMFSSDNGPWNEMPERMFGENIVQPWDHGSVGPLRGGKANTYEGGHRVPFIARWPGHIPAAQYSLQSLVMFDMMPTLADVIGFPGNQLPRDLDGVNNWPVISGKSKGGDRTIYYLNAGGKYEAVRKGDWKLRIAKVKDAEVQLFNLKSDISERHNVANRYPGKVEELTALLKHQEETGY